MNIFVEDSKFQDSTCCLVYSSYIRIEGEDTPYVDLWPPG